MQKIKEVFNDLKFKLKKKINSIKINETGKQNDDVNIKRSILNIFSFLLTLFSVYICFNIFVDSILILFNGIASKNYSNLNHIFNLILIPITYLLVIERENVKYKINDDTKLNLFHFYAFLFITYFVSMIIVLSNRFILELIFGSPNYLKFLSEDMHLVKPTLVSLAFLEFFMLYTFIYAKYKKKITYNNDVIYSIVHSSVSSFLKTGKLSTKLSDNIFNKENNKTNNILEDYYAFNLGSNLNNEKIYISAPDIFKHMMLMGNEDLKDEYILSVLIKSFLNKKMFFKKESEKVLNNLLEKNIAFIKPEYIYEKDNLKFKMLAPKKEYKREFKNLTADITTIDGNTEKDLGFTVITEKESAYEKIIDILNMQNLRFKTITNHMYRNVQEENILGLNPFAKTDLDETSENILYLLNLILKNIKYSFTYDETKAFIKNLVKLLKITYPKADTPNLEDLLKLLKDQDYIKILNDQLKIKYKEEKENGNTSLDELKIIEEIYTYFETNVFEKNLNNVETESTKQKIFRDLMAVVPTIESFLNKNISNLFLNKKQNLNYKNILDDSNILIINLQNEDIYEQKILNEYIRYEIYNGAKNRDDINMQNPHFLVIQNIDPFIEKIKYDNFKIFEKEYLSFIIGKGNSGKTTAETTKLFNNIPNKIKFIKTNEEKENYNNTSKYKIEIAPPFAVYNIINRGKINSGIFKLENSKINNQIIDTKTNPNNKYNKFQNEIILEDKAKNRNKNENTIDKINIKPNNKIQSKKVELNSKKEKEEKNNDNIKNNANIENNQNKDDNLSSLLEDLEQEEFKKQDKKRYKKRKYIQKKKKNKKK